MNKPNTKWFADRIAANDKSMRSLAVEISETLQRSFDSSALSRSINGQRQWQLAEIEAFCQLTGSSTVEFLRAAGMKVRL